MVFGGPLLKKPKSRRKIIAFPTEKLKEILASHLIAVSVINEYDDVDIELPEELKYSIPLSLRIIKHGIRN